MQQVSFEEILKAWVLEYDDRVPSDRRARREAFIILFGNLQDHGFGKEELTTAKKEKIVRSCVNPNYRDKKALRNWISMVLNDLESAILIYYGTIKIRKDVVTPEMAAKLEGMEIKAAEVKALKKPDSEESEENSNYDPDKPLDLEDESLNLDEAVKDVVSNPRQISETFEITDEMFEESDGPVVVWDEDFMKKLESKDE